MASADTAATATEPGSTAFQKPARDHLIHILRGVAIACVVGFHQLVQHIFPDFSGLVPAPVGYEWVNWFLVWCLPWFVLTGGAVTYWGVKRMRDRSAPGPERRKATLSFLWGRLVRMLVPYYVFVAIMAPVEILLGVVGGESGICHGFGLKQALTWLIPFPHADCLQLPQWPFWFLMVYIPVTMISPLMVAAFEKKWGRWLLIAVPTAILLWNDRLFYSIKDINLYDSAAVAGWQTPERLVAVVLNVYLGFVVFFAIGFTYAAGMWRTRRRLAGGLGLALMTTTILLMTVGPYTTGGQQFPMMAGYLFWGIGTFLIMISASDLVERAWRLPIVKPAIDWLSTKSYTIYIWHSTLIVAAWWTLQAVGANGPLYAMPMILGHLAIFVVSWIYIVPTVNFTYRFESWTFPPRWWAKRHKGLSEAERAGAAVTP